MEPATRPNGHFLPSPGLGTPRSPVAWARQEIMFYGPAGASGPRPTGA